MSDELEKVQAKLAEADEELADLLSEKADLESQLADVKKKLAKANEKRDPLRLKEMEIIQAEGPGQVIGNG